MVIMLIESNKYSPSGSTKECRPDYEEIYARNLKKLTAVKNFLKSLKVFMREMSIHYFDAKELSQLFGSLEIDIMRREDDLAEISKHIDKS